MTRSVLFRQTRRLAALLALSAMASAATPAPAAPLILLAPIDSYAQVGGPVALQEKAWNGCRFVGVLKSAPSSPTAFLDKIADRLIRAQGGRTASLSIELISKSCQNVISPVKMEIVLNPSHFHIDEDGGARSGYGPGEIVAVQSP